MLLYFSLPAIPSVLSGGLISVVAYTVVTGGFHVPVFQSIASVVISVVAVTMLLFLAIYCIYGFVSYVSFKRDILKSIN